MSCKYIKTDAAGNVIHAQHVLVDEIPVLSSETIPKGGRRYERAFIIDKMDVAICDGEDVWYATGSGGVVSATAGQTWAALFG